MEQTALIAMSGGVDSAVAAYLTQQAGFSCVGATMHLHGEFTGVEDARQVAGRLGMPFHVFNFTEDFAKEVIDRFVCAYECGATPNPCIDCNKHMKFGKVFELMDELGIEQFDLMFGALLLLHLKKPVTVLKKLRHFLADDGYMVIRGSDDGSVLAYNDDGLVDKIIEKCHVTVGFSDRHNGRKLYGQLESAGFKDIQVRTFIKDISGKDVDERDEIFFERFAYRINNFRKNHEADPHNQAKNEDYIFMKYALQELEEVFTKHDFWYCEQDFLAYGRAK